MIAYPINGNGGLPNPPKPERPRTELEQFFIQQKFLNAYRTIVESTTKLQNQRGGIVTYRGTRPSTFPAKKP